MRYADWLILAVLMLIAARIEPSPVVSGALVVSAVACVVAAVNKARRTR